MSLYNLADLFVLLTREEPPDVEGFGLVFLEAAACGLPSVGGGRSPCCTHTLDACAQAPREPRETA